MKKDLAELFREREYSIGDRVFINIPEGVGGVIFAYIAYETHLEYFVRTIEGVHQLDAVSLSEDKVII